MSCRFLAGRTRELEISRLTNSGVPKPSEVPSFLLRARRNKQLLAQALSVITEIRDNKMTHHDNKLTHHENPKIEAKERVHEEKKRKGPKTIDKLPEEVSCLKKRIYWTNAMAWLQQLARQSYYVQYIRDNISNFLY